jgi:hypothetical protein
LVAVVLSATVSAHVVAQMANATAPAITAVASAKSHMTQMVSVAPATSLQNTVPTAIKIACARTVLNVLTVVLVMALALANLVGLVATATTLVSVVLVSLHAVVMVLAILPLLFACAILATLVLVATIHVQVQTATVTVRVVMAFTELVSARVILVTSTTIQAVT